MQRFLARFSGNVVGVVCAAIVVIALAELVIGIVGAPFLLEITVKWPAPS